MNSQRFIKSGALFTIGATLVNPFEGNAKELDFDTLKKTKKAKNIILVLSDGMSTRTLDMAYISLNTKTGKGSN